MVEWSIAAVLKTVDGKLSGGSNPSLCAKKRRKHFLLFSLFCLEGENARFIGGSCDERETKSAILNDLVGERGHFGKANLPLSAPKREESIFCFLLFFV